MSGFAQRPRDGGDDGGDFGAQALRVEARFVDELLPAGVADSGWVAGTRIEVVEGVGDEAGTHRSVLRACRELHSHRGARCGALWKGEKSGGVEGSDECSDSGPGRDFGSEGGAHPLFALEAVLVCFCLIDAHRPSVREGGDADLLGG